MKSKEEIVLVNPSAAKIAKMKSEKRTFTVKRIINTNSPDEKDVTVINFVRGKFKSQDYVTVVPQFKKTVRDEVNGLTNTIACFEGRRSDETENLQSDVKGIMAAVGSLMQNEARKQIEAASETPKKLRFNMDLDFNNNVNANVSGNVNEVFAMIARLKHTDTVDAAMSGGDRPAKNTQTGHAASVAIKEGLKIGTSDEVLNLVDKILS